MKRMLMIFATGLAAVALVACDSTDSDSDGDNPAPVETTAPSDSTGPTDSTPTDSTTTDPTETPTEPIDDFERVEELAPIDAVEVLFAESSPVQHRLHIVSGLPSGCASFERADLERDGTTFTVEVVNTVPAPDEDVACTMIYGSHETTLELGSDLETGTEYTVDVNGEVATFIAE